MTFNVRPTGESRWSRAINETIDRVGRVQTQQNSSVAVTRRTCVIIESGFSLTHSKHSRKRRSLPAAWYTSVTEDRCLNYAENHGADRNGAGRLKLDFRNGFKRANRGRVNCWRLNCGPSGWEELFLTEGKINRYANLIFVLKRMFNAKIYFMAKWWNMNWTSVILCNSNLYL